MLKFSAMFNQNCESLMQGMNTGNQCKAVN